MSNIDLKFNSIFSSGNLGKNIDKKNYSIKHATKW